VCLASAHALSSLPPEASAFAEELSAIYKASGAEIICQP